MLGSAGSYAGRARAFAEPLTRVAGDALVSILLIPAPAGGRCEQGAGSRRLAGVAEASETALSEPTPGAILHTQPSAGGHRAWRLSSHSECTQVGAAWLLAAAPTPALLPIRPSMLSPLHSAAPGVFPPGSLGAGCPLSLQTLLSSHLRASGQLTPHRVCLPCPLWGTCLV